MNKRLKYILKIIATLAFTGLLLSIAFNGNSHLELACCAVATICSYIIFFTKENPKE